MCLIIDANKASDFCKQKDPYLKPLWEWINGGGRIACGGHLLTELYKIGAMQKLMLEWSRRGTLIRHDEKKIKEIETEIIKKCKSDDPHVIALAVVSKASIIVTGDKDLISDLKNTNLVGFRRKIYKENSASPDRVDRHITMLRGSDCP
jgi:hypothetical protein